MDCKSEKDIPKYETLHTENGEKLKNILAQNAELTQQKQTDKTEFLAIRKSITADDMEAIQEERYNLRKKYMTELSQKLRNKYGNDYTMLKYVERGQSRAAQKDAVAAA